MKPVSLLMNEQFLRSHAELPRRYKAELRDVIKDKQLPTPFLLSRDIDNVPLRRQ